MPIDMFSFDSFGRAGADGGFVHDFAGGFAGSEGE